MLELIQREQPMRVFVDNFVSQRQTEMIKNSKENLHNCLNITRTIIAEGVPKELDTELEVLVEDIPDTEFGKPCTKTVAHVVEQRMREDKHALRPKSAAGPTHQVQCVFFDLRMNNFEKKVAWIREQREKERREGGESAEEDEDQDQEGPADDGFDALALAELTAQIMAPAADLQPMKFVRDVVAF